MGMSEKEGMWNSGTPTYKQKLPLQGDPSGQIISVKHTLLSLDFRAGADQSEAAKYLFSQETHHQHAAQEYRPHPSISDTVPPDGWLFFPPHQSSCLLMLDDGDWFLFHIFIVMLNCVHRFQV